jgi:MGT family glycosyltransferase
MPTIAFLPEPGAWGPTNNCIAIAEILRERGARVVFALDATMTGAADSRGFEEEIYAVAAAAEDAGTDDVWADYIRQMAPEYRKPTIEQIETVVKPIWETLADQCKVMHEPVTACWERVRPDVIVTDNVSAFPSVLTAGVPWVRAVSCNELELGDPALPPVFSGISTSEEQGRAEFRAEYRRQIEPVWAAFDGLCRDLGAPPLPELEFQYVSPHLNLFLYPREAAYPGRRAPIGEQWHRLDSTVRAADRPFSVDDVLPGEGKVVYLSLGSLGCMDTALMQRLIDLLDRSGHRAIVSMGAMHEELRLGERMYGEPVLPQTAILPQCDLVVTHAGNNTFCEAFHFGLPMICHPLFWDQYDNAQRAADLGVGARLRSYEFTDEEFLGAVERLLADEALHARMQAIATRIQSDPGRVRAADLILRLAGADAAAAAPSGRPATGVD